MVATALNIKRLNLLHSKNNSQIGSLNTKHQFPRVPASFSTYSTSILAGNKLLSKFKY